MCDLLATVSQSIDYAHAHDIVLPPALAYRAMRVGALKLTPDYGSAQHMAAWKASQRRVDPYIEELMGQLDEFFTDQERALLEMRAANPDEFNRSYWERALKNRMYGVVSAAMFAIGGSEIDKLNDLGADIPGFENTVRLQAALARILEYTSYRVNDTTYRDLITLFQEAAENGESLRAIQDRLNEFFNGRKEDWQLERIARTTMTSASNKADVEAWQQSEVVTGKTWLSALIPKRTRPDHADAHGQTVPLDGKFQVGGELLSEPGDPAGSPGNIINCLCTQQAEVDF